MGNLTSSSTNRDSNKQLMLEELELPEATLGTDAFDFSILADTRTIQEYTKIDKSSKHEQYPKIFNHKTHFTNWMNEKSKLGEEWISKEDLFDKFTQQGVAYETIEKFWNEIDEFSNNKIHLPWLLDVIDGGMPKSNLTDCIKRLTSCVMLPSISDVFLNNDVLIKVQKDHAKMLNCFVKNCRPSIKLVTPDSIKFFFTIAKSRHTLLCNHFEKLCVKMLDPDKSDDSSSDQKVLIDQPYTNITVSSNQNDIHHLTDGVNSTNWTSSGSLGTHYIRFYMKPNICVDQLSMTYGPVNSYTPKNIQVVGGMSEDTLRNLAHKSLTNTHTGHQTEVLISHCSKFYNIIQINIKDCFEGGCDTRISGVNMRGYRYTSIPITESEATHTWLLTLVTCTAANSIQLQPLLRASILQQTQNYFQYIPPLSLTYSSPNRALFMGKEFISQLQIFLQPLIHNVKHGIDVDAFNIVIKFCMAHGYLHLTLPLFIEYIKAVLEIGNASSLSLNCLMDLNKFETTRNEIISAHPPPIGFRVESSEGFLKSNEDLCKIITYGDVDSSDAVCYASKEGERVLNLLLVEKKNRDFRIKKINVLKKTEKDKQPHVCMVFCIPQSEIDPKTAKPFDCAKLLDLYRQYDNWTIQDWKNYQDQKSENAQTDSFSTHPVCFFDLKSSESGELIHIWPDICFFCLIKILGPTPSEEDESSKKKILHLSGIQCFGDVNTSSVRNILDTKLNANYPLPTDTDDKVTSMVFIMRFLASHVLLIRNQASILERLVSNCSLAKKDYLSTSLYQSHLFMDDLTFKLVWDTYLILEKLFTSHEEHRVIGMEISLLFLLACIPFLISIEKKKKVKDDETKEIQLQALNHLSNFLNNDTLEPSLLGLVDEIITQGVTVMMSDEEVRIEKLLNGVKLACSTEKYPRATITVVAALVHYYSENEMSKLLKLPNIAKLDQEKEIEFDIEFLMDTITPLLNIFYRKTEAKVNQFVSPDTTYCETDIQILPLLTSIQKTIFNWSYTLAFNEKKSEHTLKFSKILLCRFLSLLEKEVNDILKLLNKYTHVPHILDAFQDSLLANIFSQTVTLLTSFYTLASIRDYVIHTFQGFVHKLTEVINSIPDFEVTYCSLPEGSNCILNEWQRESTHHSYSNLDQADSFTCHGADFFIIEFNNKCKFENGTEYLEFTDQEGKKQRFTGSYGSASLPSHFTFNCQSIQMRYVTSGSEYGYKFTLKAYGRAKKLHWFRNLNFSLSYLFGKFCSANFKQSEISNGLTDEELVMLQSNIGKHIFRGGLQKSRFIRSYSGIHHANTDSDSKVEDFIRDFISEKHENQKAIDFIQGCQASYKQPRIGGVIADKAINATFSALLWHSQELREEVARYEAKKEPGKISSRIANVYRLAESIRSPILVNKHILIKKKEDTLDSNIDPEMPFNDCIEKALFLLKFSGLSRSELDIDKAAQKRNKIARKKLKYGSSVSQADKEPHVDMILNFVNKDSYSIQRIRDDMEERTRLAQNRILTYSFCRDFLLFASKSSPSTEAKNNLSIFLTSLFSDYSITPLHYGGNLDGCGLEIERKIRESFYSLIQKLFIWIWNEDSYQDKLILSPTDNFLLIILHYFFNNTWKDFDYKFVKEYCLPNRLYVTAYTILAKSSLNKKDEKTKFTDSLQEYIGSISILLFYSLAMQTSSRIQEVDVSIDEVYLNYAIQVYYDCLQVLVLSIRAGLEAIKKKDSEKNSKKETTAVKSKIDKKEDDKQDDINSSFTALNDSKVLSTLSLIQFSQTTAPENATETVITEGATATNVDETSNQLETERKQTRTENSSETVNTVHKSTENTKQTTEETQNAALEEDTSFQNGVSVNNSTSEILDLNGSTTDDTNKTQDLEVESDEPKSKPEVELTDKIQVDENENKNEDVEVKSKIDDTNSKQNSEQISNESDMEMIFGEKYFTQNLCALGGLAPIDLSNPRWSCSDVSVQLIINYEILPLLFEIIQYNHMKESQLLALTLLVRFISRSDPEHIDEMMPKQCPELIPNKQKPILTEVTPHEDDTEKLLGDSSSSPLIQSASPATDKFQPDGTIFMLFLTNLGTEFLSKHKHLQLSSVGRCLYELLNEKAWTRAYMHNLENHLQYLPYTINVDCVFHLLVLAGFPELPAFGMQVEVEKNSKLISALMVQTKESTTNYQVILKDARMITNSLQKDVKINQPSIPLIEISKISYLIDLTIKCIKITEKSAEQNYVTFLLLKTINNFIQKDTTCEVIRTVMQSGILDLITQIACKPTSIDKKWQISELEHICMTSYPQEATIAESPLPDSAAPTDISSDKMKEEDTNRQKIEERDPLNNVSDEIKDIFVNLSTAFACQLSVIRAAYEHLKQNKEKLIENVQRWYQDDKGLQVPKEVQKIAKDWEPLEDIPEASVFEEFDETLDNGLLKHTPIIVNNQQFNILQDEKETTKVKDILIPPKVKEKSDYEKMKMESKVLHSDKTKETMHKKELKKLINALPILQSRHILFSLILTWKLEEPLCNDIFESLEFSRIFSILYYAQCSLPKNNVQQLIIQLGKHSSGATKKALAVEASKILGPIKGTILYKESDHPNTKTICTNKISANNAIQYIVTLDPLCEFGDDDVILLGDESSTEKQLEIKGKDFKANKSVVMNAKSLQYKITTPKPSGWGWKFQVIVVTAGVLSYFDSTYDLLENILSNVTDFSLLPLSIIWENLYFACSFHINEKRYKILNLMGHVLRLCISYHKSLKNKKEEVTEKPDPEITVDFKLLSQFCEYFAVLSKEHTKEKKVLKELKIPTITRVLTDFFVQVEICAVTCGLEQDLSIARVLINKTEVLISTAIKNIALLSIGIDLDNIPANEFIKAKREYKPKLVSDNIVNLKELPFAGLLLDEESKSSRSSSPSSEGSSSSDSSSGIPEALSDSSDIF